jgi:hypothetical protein
MAHIWKERRDPEKHVDHMQTSQLGGFPVESASDRLIVRDVYFVEVCGFTFQFQSLDQITEALAYFRQKTYPSSRLPDVTLEHYWQRWYERLPQWLFEEPKRQRVVAALQRAADIFSR